MLTAGEQKERKRGVEEGVRRAGLEFCTGEGWRRGCIASHDNQPSLS
jgi:hypothetical protein